MGETQWLLITATCYVFFYSTGDADSLPYRNTTVFLCLYSTMTTTHSWWSHPHQSQQYSPIAALFWCSFCHLCRYYCLPLPHSPSHLSQVNKHQLSLLENAAVSPRPRSFRLCWWLQLLPLSICSCCWWYLSLGKSILSSLETTRLTHSECSTFLTIHESFISCCWLPNIMFCLTHT
jgi:hypothetical protein